MIKGDKKMTKTLRDKRECLQLERVSLHVGRPSLFIEGEREVVGEGIKCPDLDYSL